MKHEEPVLSEPATEPRPDSSTDGIRHNPHGQRVDARDLGSECACRSTGVVDSFSMASVSLLPDIERSLALNEPNFDHVPTCAWTTGRRK